MSSDSLRPCHQQLAPEISHVEEVILAQVDFLLAGLVCLVDDARDAIQNRDVLAVDVPEDFIVVEVDTVNVDCRHLGVKRGWRYSGTKQRE